MNGITTKVVNLDEIKKRFQNYLLGKDDSPNHSEILTFAIQKEWHKLRCHASFGEMNTMLFHGTEGIFAIDGEVSGWTMFQMVRDHATKMVMHRAGTMTKLEFAKHTMEIYKD